MEISYIYDVNNQIMKKSKYRCQGIEFADGEPSLSCVVTNVYSDWSRFAWPSKSLSIRVYKQGNSYVVS